MKSKVKFRSSGFGGNMTALQGFYKGFEILISDNDGENPVKGQPFSMGIYSGFSDGDSPLKQFQGQKFNRKKVIETAVNWIDRKTKKSTSLKLTGRETYVIQWALYDLKNSYGPDLLNEVRKLMTKIKRA